MEKGKLSVQTENLLPLIKKWLYSEKDIFLRELVSNGLDAITKLKKITLAEDIYQADRTEYYIDIKIDRENSILSIEDNGVGLTEDEIKKYITQIAFSGAEDFIKQYEESGASERGGIIGNFGLGFFSCFMIATKVEIHSRSWQPGGTAAFWSSEGGEEFELGPGERENRGTEIKMFVEEDSKDLLDKAKIQELVRKYCDFLPVEIRVDGSQVNRKDALWTGQPSSIKAEDYTEFYKYLYPYAGDPLFYVHLNVDYPFKLQGILYFPRLAHELDLNNSNVKIFCKQVFVTDEAAELIPKWLTVLQGIIDLPDLPLNVSRSYLQNEPQVRKIANHIIKKVADALNGEFKKNPNHFREIWPDIAPFVKYGMMNDEKFYEAALPSLIFETVQPVGADAPAKVEADEADSAEGAAAGNGSTREFVSLDDYLTNNKDKTGEKIYYSSDPDRQTGPLKLFQSQGIQVLKMDAAIDNHFLNFMEGKHQEYRFSRIDAELADSVLDKAGDSRLVDAEDKSLGDRLTEVFKQALGNDSVTIRVEALKTEDIPAMILLPEQMRRFSEMSAFMSRELPPFPEIHTLLVNSKNAVIQGLAKPTLVGGEETGLSKNERIARQVYNLARLAHGGMNAKELEAFLSESHTLLETFL